MGVEAPRPRGAEAPRGLEARPPTPVRGSVAKGDKPSLAALHRPLRGLPCKTDSTVCGYYGTDLCPLYVARGAPRVAVVIIGRW